MGRSAFTGCRMQAGASVAQIPAGSRYRLPESPASVFRRAPEGDKPHYDTL